MEPIAKVDESEARLAKIRQAILKRFPRGKSPKQALLKQALQDAEFYHSNQFRKSGEPAIIHPYRVALSVSETGMGIEAVILALLHDVIEDTEFTKDEVAAKYGDWLAEAVDGLTKVAAPAYRTNSGAGSLETYRKLLISSLSDLRTLQVKIFDRLDNMRDLGFLSRTRQRRIAMETMQVYMPMAQRLGQQDIADELSTLCFRYLYPKRFNRTLSQLRERIKEEQKKVKGLRRVLDAVLKELCGGGLSVQPRYHKISDYVFENIQVARALIGFTVTVPGAEDCYAVLGRLHREYRVVPNSIRDYISNPKPNRHQSLESKIFIGGEAVSIKIFSKDMEAVNRTGILADWQGSQEEVSRYYESYLELLEQFTDSEDLRMEDVLRFGQMDTLQIFTPIGEVLTFPQRSTVLDFAFAIHTELGLHCDGARVEGRPAQRFEELRDGSMVEVLTTPSTNPSANWLGHVHTAKAKMAIRRFLRGQRLSRATEVGENLFRGMIRRLGLDPEAFLADAAFGEALKIQGLTTPQFFQQVGTRQLQIKPFLQSRGLVPGKSLERLDSQDRSGLLRYLKPRFRSKDPDLKISEFGDAFIHLAPCCSPLQGDAILGVQQDNGIIIHRTECQALDDMQVEALVSVGWELSREESPYRFIIQMKDRPGMIYRIGKIMRDLKVNIQDMNVKPREALMEAQVSILVDPISAQTYQKIVARLRGIKEVVRIS